MADSNENLERGRALRQKVFGAPKPGAPRSSAADLAPDLRRLSDEVLFGQVWSRPGLELPLRSLVTISALTALGGREAQLKAHIKGGLNVGLTREQVIEAIMHLAFYAGIPAANNALQAAKEAFDEQDA